MITPARPDRLRQLLGNDVSFERVWHELSSLRGRAAASTFEALMFALRERGIAALTERKIRSWLSDCGKSRRSATGFRNSSPTFCASAKGNCAAVGPPSKSKAYCKHGVCC